MPRAMSPPHIAKEKGKKRAAGQPGPKERKESSVEELDRILNDFGDVIEDPVDFIEAKRVFGDLCARLLAEYKVAGWSN